MSGILWRSFPVASTPAPFTERFDVSLVTNNTVCVSNDYELRVHCTGRDGDIVGVFGTEGEGPGEFSDGPALTRGPGGRVATISEDRFALFESDGRIVSETKLPIAYLQLAAAVGETILAHHFAGGADVTPVEINAATGEVIWERPGLDQVVDTECGSVALGVASPSGGWAFPACQRELVFLASRDDASATVVVSPTYSAELPNDRDIAEVESASSRYRWLDPDTFRETPKRNHLRRGSLKYDGWGRLWVATERDRDSFSYFDLYEETTHLGSVRIRDRVLGYDIYGSTLAALVERPPDTDGVSRLATDWYDISETEFQR